MTLTESNAQLVLFLNKASVFVGVIALVVAVMLLCIGCGNTDTPDTEENTEVESEALQAAREYAITKWGRATLTVDTFLLENGYLDEDGLCEDRIELEEGEE